MQWRNYCFSLQSLEKYNTLPIIFNKLSSESEFITKLDHAQGQDNINGWLVEIEICSENGLGPADWKANVIFSWCFSTCQPHYVKC